MSRQAFIDANDRLNTLDMNHIDSRPEQMEVLAVWEAHPAVVVYDLGGDSGQRTAGFLAECLRRRIERLDTFNDWSTT